MRSPNVATLCQNCADMGKDKASQHKSPRGLGHGAARPLQTRLKCQAALKETSEVTRPPLAQRSLGGQETPVPKKLWRSTGPLPTKKPRRVIAPPCPEKVSKIKRAPPQEAPSRTNKNRGHDNSNNTQTNGTSIRSPYASLCKASRL